MTDRSEIERLLNQTGRTLEGLPEEHSREERNRELSTWMPWGEKMCHQSDVIELLVGALRDALDKPMQKPLTLEDLAITQTGDEVWEERKIGDSIHLCRTPALVLACMCYQSDDDFYKYGHRVRAWKKMPTDEEMEAAPWQN